MPAVLEPHDVVAARQPPIDHPAIFQDAPETQPIARRQQQVVYQGVIPAYYNTSGPTPGAVVGIVLGSVAGFLLLIALLYALANSGSFYVAGRARSVGGQEEIVVRRRRNSQAGATRSRVTRRTEVREVSRSPRRSAGRSTVVVEERRAPPRARSVIVEERQRVPGDDVVEVTEEREEFRERRGSRRGSTYR